MSPQGAEYVLMAVEMHEGFDSRAVSSEIGHLGGFMWLHFYLPVHHAL